MDRLFLVLLAVSAVVVLMEGVEGRDMEIHMFNVGQANSQLIVFPSGFTVLIDVPELGPISAQTAKMITSKIINITGGTHIDVAVATHLHLDHIGYATHGGFWWLIEQGGITIDRLVDRDHSEWNDTNGDGKCTKDELIWHNVGDATNLGAAWACYVLNPANTKVYSVRQTAQLGSHTQIDPPDEGAGVVIISTDGVGAVDKKGRNISGDHSTESMPPSENDFSVGLAIFYGQFSYVTTADNDGVYASSSTYTYNNIEAVIGPRVGGEVDMFEADHHGSQYSSNAKYLSIMKPQVSLISCGQDNMYKHPNQDTLDRLLGYGDVYLTQIGVSGTNYRNSVISSSDILVSVSAVYGGRTFSVTVLNGTVTKQYTSKGNTTCLEWCGNKPSEAKKGGHGVLVAILVTLGIVCGTCLVAALAVVGWVFIRKWSGKPVILVDMDNATPRFTKILGTPNDSSSPTESSSLYTPPKI